MKKKEVKIFIDGREGTTGLRIVERLAAREGVTLLTLPEERRKDPDARQAMIRESDITFLCLPDEAARESVALAEGTDTVLIDTSTAHRTAEGWAYGLPELSPAARERIRTSRRIAVPGCHASGFIALVRPLIDAGHLSPEARLTAFSVTGYSGGGKKMIAGYEDSAREAALDAPRQYALGQTHKHIPEMVKLSGLSVAPVFCPIVADYYSGMTVTVPLFAADLAPGVTPDTVRALYKHTYTTPLLTYDGSLTETGFVPSNARAGKDSMGIAVAGNAERILLIAHYDNLGKGASGAAVECLNLVLGEEDTYGLTV